MNIKTAIIADDFTGAGDSCIHFCHAGFSVFLPLMLTNTAFPETLEILAVNTESRLDQGAVAYQKIAQAVDKCRAWGVQSFYKKIDSTMRGNICDEIKAVVDKGHYSAAVICPAAPDVGRTVVNGQCLLHGIPIDQTETGQDHLNPVKSSFIKDFFAPLLSARIAHIKTSELARGPEFLIKRVNGLLDEGTTHIICDATNKQHLLLTIAALKNDPRLLLAGAAGLAAAIAETTPSHHSDLRLAKIPKGNILVSSGSRMEVSRKQLANLTAKHDFVTVQIPVSALVLGEQAVVDKFWNDLQQLKAIDSHAFILTPDSHEEVYGAGGQRDSSEKIASFLAEATAFMCRNLDISVVVSIGGHTTFKTVQSLHATGVMYEGEVIPGTALGQLQLSKDQHPLTLITKSGSFGRDDALLRVYDFITAKMAAPDKTKENPFNQKGENCQPTPRDKTTATVKSTRIRNL